jgi:hypothetical protein
MEALLNSLMTEGPTLALLGDSANAEIIGIAKNDGTDYANRIIVLTGEPIAVAKKSGSLVQLFNAVLMDSDGGSTDFTEIGMFNSGGERFKPGTRFVIENMEDCFIEPNLVLFRDLQEYSVFD